MVRVLYTWYWVVKSGLSILITYWRPRQDQVLFRSIQMYPIISSLKELIELGKELEYEGKQLREFVREEQIRAWEIRQEKREFKRKKLKIEAEKQEKLRQVSPEKRERQRPFELERLKVEALENRKKEKAAEERQSLLELEDFEDGRRGTREPTPSGGTVLSCSALDCSCSRN